MAIGRFSNSKPQSGESLGSQLFPGLLVGSVAAIFAVSHATLVFSGPLAAWLPLGVTLALGSLVLGMIVQSVIGGLQFGIMATDSTPLSVQGLLVGAMVAEFHATVPLDPAVILLALIISTAGSGLLLILAGALGAGRLVAFLPYSVVGGFMAGSSLLALRGALKFLRVTPIDWFAGLGVPPTIPLVTLTLSVIMVPILSTAMRRGPVATIITIVLGSLAYLAGLHLFGFSVEEARALGLMLPSLEGGAARYGALASLADLPWDHPWTSYGLPILHHLSDIGVLSLVIALSVMLHASGIEAQLHQRIQVDRELISCGLANVASGLGGGFSVLLSLSRTLLLHRLGGRRRTAPLAAAAMALIALLIGQNVLSFLAPPILAALLIGIAVELVARWLIRPEIRASRVETLVMLTLAGLIAIFGLVTGVLVGLALSSATFLWTYSRTPVIRHALDGVSFKSSAERSPLAHRGQTAGGERLAYFILQGFLFFGSASRLSDVLSARLEAAPHCAALVLDLRVVSGADSSAVLRLRRLMHEAIEKGTTIFLSGASPALRRQFNGSGAVFVDDLEAAATAAETLLLDTAGDHSTPSDMLAVLFPDGDDRAALEPLLKPVSFAAGTTLIRRGDTADALHLLVEGTVSITLGTNTASEIDQKGAVSLRRVGAGNLVGEIGFLLNRPREATVVCDVDCRTLMLDRDGLEQLRRIRPSIDITLATGTLRIVADRLSASNRLVERLLR